MARAEDEKRKKAEAKARAQQLHLPVISDEQGTILTQQEAAETLLPDQELPGNIHIENIGDEIEDDSESNGEDLPIDEDSSFVVDEHPLGEDDPERGNHHTQNDASEPVEDVSTVLTLPEEVVSAPQTTFVSLPEKGQEEGRRGFHRRKHWLLPLVCLVIVLDLTIGGLRSRDIKLSNVVNSVNFPEP